MYIFTISQTEQWTQRENIFVSVWGSSFSHSFISRISRNVCELSGWWQLTDQTRLQNMFIEVEIYLLLFFFICKIATLRNACKRTKHFKKVYYSLVGANSIYKRRGNLRIHGFLQFSHEFRLTFHCLKMPTQTIMQRDHWAMLFTVDWTR